MAASVFVVSCVAAIGACGSDITSVAGLASTAGGLVIQGDAGSPNLIEDFNPYAGSQLHGTYLLYEPLELVSGLNGAYTPYLATSYKFTSPTTLVYTLRQGVKWSDGQPLTSADVLFSFNLLKKVPALDGTGIWTVISSVKAAGTSITFTFIKPDVPFAAAIAATPIVPAHIWSKIADPATFTNLDPVGENRPSR
jgi:peptide/nickel transport system substrate-binding protein